MIAPGLFGNYVRSGGSRVQNLAADHGHQPVCISPTRTLEPVDLSTISRLLRPHRAGEPRVRPSTSQRVVEWLVVARLIARWIPRVGSRPAEHAAPPTEQVRSEQANTSSQPLNSKRRWNLRPVTVCMSCSSTRLLRRVFRGVPAIRRLDAGSKTSTRLLGPVQSKRRCRETDRQGREVADHG